MVVPDDHVHAARLRSLAVAEPGASRVVELGTLGLDLVRTEHFGTLVHEFHHFWQVMAFPFQYLQALRELNFLLSVVHSLALIPGRLSTREFELDQPWRDTLMAPTRTMAVQVANDTLVLHEETADESASPSAWALSETGLLEASTSIFEFQALAGASGDAAGYQRWLNVSRSRYSSVFRLLSQFWDADEAYAALPSLVRAAFHTTEPCATFANLLVEAPRQIGPAHPLGSDVYFARVYDLLADVLPTVRGSDYPAATSPRPPWAQAPYFISESDGRQWLEPDSIHLATPVAEAYYEARARDIIAMSDLLRPHDRAVIDRLWAVGPPFITMTFRHPGVLMRDSVTVVSPILGDSTLHPAHEWADLGTEGAEVTVRGAMAELLRLRGVGLTLANVPLGLRHHCHHHSCPMHETGVCRFWTAIPRRWDRCTFPAWFAAASNHVLTRAGDLVPRSAYRDFPEDWPEGWRVCAGMTQRDWLARSDLTAKSKRPMSWPHLE